jgi:biopolymer transport protein ExbB
MLEASAVTAAEGWNPADAIESSRMAVQRLFGEALDIWLAGGWAMVAIAVVALVLFGLGTHLHLEMRASGYGRVPERIWRRWIEDPAARQGRLGDLLDEACNAEDLRATARLFEEVRGREIAPWRRDLRVLRICVGAAPLVGLLGTVTGMLATFAALSSGEGADKTMAMVAEGISEALITTETGLVVALPGLFLQYQLQRKQQRITAFLEHVEAVCMQVVHQRRQRAA